MTLSWTPVVRGLLPLLPSFGIRPEVAVEAIAYGEVVSWSLLPLFLFTALRRYLQATNAVKPVMFALVSANIMNAAVAWVLIFGHMGLPVMGVRGAGWATVAARVYLCLFLVVYVLRHERRSEAGLRGVPLRFERERIGKLVRLGFPAGCNCCSRSACCHGDGDRGYARCDFAAHHIALRLRA
jgi:MATE family multidrug resistance protein